MSVLACNRKGCENVMCSRLSDNYGYICDECFQELCEHGDINHIDAFMESDKRDRRTYSEAAYAYLDKVFPLTSV